MAAPLVAAAAGMAAKYLAKRQGKQKIKKADKENAKDKTTKEISGEMRFREPRQRTDNEYITDYGRTPRMSDDMKKGGKVKGFRDGGIYTADMGQPPQDIDGGSAPPKKPTPKIIKPKGLSPKQSEAARNESKKELSEFKRRTPDKLTKFKKDDLILTGKDKASFRKGGSIDGIAQRGKTNCKMR